MSNLNESPADRQRRINDALTRYAREEIDELTVAREMGMSLGSDHERLMAIQSVRNLTSGHATSQDKAITPNPHGITTVHGDGRTQIPKKIREYLNVEDGSYVFWYEVNGMIVLSGKQMDSNWMRGSYTLDAPRIKPRLIK
jgi:hypothetical protein